MTEIHFKSVLYKYYMNFQDVDAMYYCNTCNQPLCGNCREATHKAKMFSLHEIVSLAKRTKEAHKKCGRHSPLILTLKCLGKNVGAMKFVCPV